MPSTESKFETEAMGSQLFVRPFTFARKATAL
jgi:hypothetical protein